MWDQFADPASPGREWKLHWVSLHLLPPEGNAYLGLCDSYTPALHSTACDSKSQKRRRVQSIRRVLLMTANQLGFSLHFVECCWSTSSPATSSSVTLRLRSERIPGGSWGSPVSNSKVVKRFEEKILPCTHVRGAYAGDCSSRSFDKTSTPNLNSIRLTDGPTHCLKPGRRGKQGLTFAASVSSSVVIFTPRNRALSTRLLRKSGGCLFAGIPSTNSL